VRQRDVSFNKARMYGNIQSFNKSPLTQIDPRDALPHVQSVVHKVGRSMW